MAKYLFLNLPAYGHVNPTLALAQELVRRGQEVSYYLTEEFRNAVQATGASFHPYESKMQDLMKRDPSSLESDKAPLASLGTMMLEDANFVPPQVIDHIRAEKPDAIVYDFMCIWAQSVIEELQVPAISTRPTFASNDHFNLFQQVREHQGEHPDASSPIAARFFAMSSRVERLNIAFIPREYQPLGETFDERYLFVGPPILLRDQAIDFPFDQLRNEQPLLYISLGSVFNDQPAFYQLCFEAFSEQPWQVVLSIGKYIDLAQLGPIPKNFLCSPYVPQLQILPRTQVFVTHAGTNSVMESLYYGIPMVTIPQQPEQKFHAQRVKNLGAGLMLDRETMTASLLHETVERIAQDKSYREHALHFQQTIRAAGGHQRAAEAIMQLVETPSRQELSPR